MATVNVQGTDEYGNLIVKVIDAEEGMSAARRARLYEAAPALLAALNELDLYLDFGAPFRVGETGPRKPDKLNAAFTKARDAVRAATTAS